jgi:hypothetical protein
MAQHQFSAVSPRTLSGCDTAWERSKCFLSQEETGRQGKEIRKNAWGEQRYLMNNERYEYPELEERYQRSLETIQKMTDQEMLAAYTTEMLKLKRLLRFGRQSEHFQGYPKTSLINRYRRILVSRKVDIPRIHDLSNCFESEASLGEAGRNSFVTEEEERGRRRRDVGRRTLWHSL